MPSYGADPVVGNIIVDGPTIAVSCRLRKTTGKETKKEWKQDIKPDKELRKMLQYVIHVSY
jgi:hypothetical protein